MALKATITFKDSQDNFSTMRFKGAAGKTLTDVQTLKTALAALSDCDVRAEGLIEKNYYDVAGGDDINSKAIVTGADSDGEVHKWSLPGYNGTPVQDDDGKHMADADRATAIAAIETFTGLSLTELRSPYIITL